MIYKNRPDWNRIIASIKVTSTFILLISMLNGCSPRFDYAVLPQENRPSNTEPSTLFVSEIVQLEALVADCVPHLSRSLHKYKFQIVPYQNKTKHKLVWVNAFCSKSEVNWKEEPVIVFDGGDCYFTVTIDLTENECVSVYLNGVT